MIICPNTPFGICHMLLKHVAISSFEQVYYPDQYGGYVPQPPPHGTQMVYSADGQYYTVAYPYQYQGMA